MPRVRSIVLEFTADSLFLTSGLKGTDRFEDVAAEGDALLFLFSFSFHCFEFVEMATVNMGISAMI